MQSAEAAERRSEALPAKTSVWSGFGQTLVRYQSDKVNPWLAARNTIGVALPLAVGAALGRIPSSLAISTGALNVAFSDSQEPYAQRARRMCAASLLVGLAVFSGALSGRNQFTAVLVAAAWAFAAGILVALSTAAADLGAISLVTLLVYAAFPMPPEKAVYAGLLALGGGLLQAVLAVAFWPLRRYFPERRALSDLYLELSRAVASAIQATESPPASAQITQAQRALAALNRDHSIEGERYRLLLSQAERMRLSLLTLRRLRTRIGRENAGGPEVKILDLYFANASRILGAIGHSLVAGAPAREMDEFLEELEALPERLRELCESPEAAAMDIRAMRNDARIQMDAVTGQLRSAVDLATTATPAGLAAFEGREAGRPWSLRLGGTLATLRANFHLQSAAFRHAIRLAVCVAAGDGLARGLELPRSYWLPMTIAIVLKPDFTATFSRGVLRLAGTFAGLVLATGLFHVMLPGATAQVVLIALLMFLMRCFGPANYGILVTAVTALVVLLLAMSGVSPKGVIAARGLNTVAGGAIALVAYWIWPTWERTQVGEAMAQMLDAYREYLREVREGYIRSPSFQALDRARLAGRLARSNLEASIDRLSAEPGTPAATVKLLSGTLASSHRLAHAMMALEAGLSSSHPVPAREVFRRFASDVDLTLYYLASALRGSPLTREALPDLREDHHALVHTGDPLTERYSLVNVETDRITNSLNTLSEELLRWMESGKRAGA
ncbi:MAG: FUSC family protein [Acidobacteriia bacterium]|nr:FUSC family protein [Terriglobia bacterium]